jgi:hypothetical protein
MRVIRQRSLTQALHLRLRESETNSTIMVVMYMQVKV